MGIASNSLTNQLSSMPAGRELKADGNRTIRPGHGNDRSVSEAWHAGRNDGGAIAAGVGTRIDLRSPGTNAVLRRPRGNPESALIPVGA